MHLVSRAFIPVHVVYLLVICDVLHAGLVPSDKLVDLESIRPRGQHYGATVPNTLDLAKRGEMAVMAMTGNLEPGKSYGVYQTFTFGNPPQMGGLTWNLPAKNARALPWLRTMCGSEHNMEIECGLMKALLDQVHPNGLAYVPIENDGAPKDTAYPYANGLIVLAAQNWMERDGNPAWLDVIDFMAKGLRKIAIKVGDRAYYPPESSYGLDETWQWTDRGESKIPYNPPEEPYLEQQGLEGCVKFEQSAPLRSIVKHYTLKNDGNSLDVAERMRRFILKPGMWEDTSHLDYPGNESGVFAGHFHGNVTSLHALLDLAVASGNDWLKQFVRQAYDHGRQVGVPRMGWFPGWYRPADHNRSKTLYLASETCGVSDMLVLGVKLTDAGLGDYWDDVDAIIRNHLIAQQITDLERMRELAGGKEHDPVLERFVGGFNQAMEGWINSTGPHVWGCCSANGAIGLYYAWHGITRFNHGVATVNMFLNRASDWVDIDSYLPYEGRVVIRNKKARSLHVRIPYWLDVDEVKCFLDDEEVEPTKVGLYLVFENLSGEGLFNRKKNVIRIEFPIHTTTSEYRFLDRNYHLTFRGGTVVNVAPRSKDEGIYQYYVYENPMPSVTPMHTVTRFVADRVLPLQ